MKIVVTGTGGLLGWHAAARLHAANCAARYRGEPPPFDLVCLDRAAFNDRRQLAASLSGADAVLHFAGVNRGTENEVREGNPAIARALIEGCREAGSAQHIVYANSTHASGDTVYGASKRIAADILASGPGAFTNVVLPHIFGECARPNYNSVTATLIDNLWSGATPRVDPHGSVRLLHAGEAARLMIGAVTSGACGELAPTGRELLVSQVLDRLRAMHEAYQANRFPDLGDPFDLALFNSYRTAGFARFAARAMTTHLDPRGMLVEAARADGVSQTFVSSTRPGHRRGDHFHIDLVERFLVVHGTATIRVRRVLTDDVQVFHVNGNAPVRIDMPPLHTHHIENTSDADVVTFFWSHRHFDPSAPDTYADPVLREEHQS